MRTPRQWWHQRRLTRTQRYLTTHPGLALAALRQDPDLATQAVLAAQGEPARRTEEFPVLTQGGANGRSALSLTFSKPTPYNLRRFSEYPPARRAINALCNPILDLPWQIAPVVDPTHPKTAAEMPAEQGQRIAIATRMLQEPNDDQSWRLWLEMLLEDVVVGGYGAAETGRTGDPARPLFLWPVDGQSVRINAAWDGHPDTPRYTQSLGYVGLSTGSHPEIPLRDDELLYLRLNPRTNTPFGLGYLEVAFATIQAFLGAFGYAERRASNATPQYLIFLGENMDTAAVRQWAAYWEHVIEGMGKAPIIGGGRAPSVQPLAAGGDDLLHLQWQEFCLRIIAMAFGLSPMKLALERDVNRNTADTQAEADWETVAPVANAVAEALTHKILWKTLGWRDLRFKWLVRGLDELQQATVLQTQYDMNALTIDEIREYYERPPLPDAKGQMTKSEFEAWAWEPENALLALPGAGGPPEPMDTPEVQEAAEPPVPGESASPAESSPGDAAAGAAGFASLAGRPAKVKGRTRRTPPNGDAPHG